MQLSLCLFAGKDTSLLTRALKSIVEARPSLADEIVIVTARPIEKRMLDLADRFSARLIPIDWQDDFSAARNAGLEAARGEWVFWVDTDEIYLGPGADELRRLLDDPQALGYYVNIHDVSNDCDDAESLGRSIRLHRSLYRRRPEIRYIGRIHEHFDPSLEQIAQERNMKMLTSEIKLEHSGFRQELRPAKLARNIRLLRLELADRPDQLYYLIELGRSLLLEKDAQGHAVLARAATLVLSERDAARAPIPLVAALLEYMLSFSPDGFPISRDDAIQLAQRWFPDSPPLLWLIARLHYQAGKLRESANCLEYLLRLAQTDQYDKLVSFDLNILGDEPRLNLGVCYARLGDAAKARTMFNTISQSSRFYSVAQKNLLALK
jgi:hypothetical protein